MKPLTHGMGNDWNPAVLDEFYKVLHGIAVDEWGYNIYPNQIEIVGSNGMLEAYSSVGLPINYPHWSFGKTLISQEREYKRGKMGLAYELVINSDPCISYLMEENTLTMQALVIAHACFGHNHFFKNNYLFNQWTMADYIIDYMRFAKHYVVYCEKKYGFEQVERILDAAHAISRYSVDKYNKPKKSKKQVEARKENREKWRQQHYDRLVNDDIDWELERIAEPEAFLDDSEIDETENLLYFIEKNSPVLKQWEKELVRIVRKVGQYFYPQIPTKLMNEGFATFSHYSLINELDNRGYVDSGFMLEFFHSHTNVINQPNYSRWNGSFNPYKLGFEMFKDMKRMCEEPTKEDELWFPELVGKPFMKEAFSAVQNFKDESFILQYLSPKLMRDMQMFVISDAGPSAREYKIKSIHNDKGYRDIRDTLSKRWDMNAMVPQVSVKDVNWSTDRSLVLSCDVYPGKAMNIEETIKVIDLIEDLWGFGVSIDA